MPNLGFGRRRSKEFQEIGVGSLIRGEFDERSRWSYAIFNARVPV